MLAGLLEPWASGGTWARWLRLFPGTLADMHVFAVDVDVEFAVIELANANADAGASAVAVAIDADSDAGAFCSMSWLGWSALLCWRLIAGLRSMLLS